MVPSCVWMTVADWATFYTVADTLWDPFIPFAGSTYVRVCDDGTIWLNETFASAVNDA